MRSYSPTELTYLQSREGYLARSLLWVSARNRTTGATETLGLWTGEEDRSFTIGGSPRLYYGAGTVLGIEAITMQAGVAVRLQRISLSILTPEVQQLFKGYDAGLAPAEIHRALFDPVSGDLIAEPQRVWKGYVDQAPEHTPELGAEGGMDVSLASAARALTRGLSLTKSDAVQQLRSADRFNRYADVSGSVVVVWGEKRATPPAPPPPPGPRTSFGRGSD